jgi:hypothetical protein
MCSVAHGFLATSRATLARQQVPGSLGDPGRGNKNAAIDGGVLSLLPDVVAPRTKCESRKYRYIARSGFPTWRMRETKWQKGVER